MQSYVNSKSWTERFLQFLIHKELLKGLMEHVSITFIAALLSTDIVMIAKSAFVTHDDLWVGGTLSLFAFFTSPLLPHTHKVFQTGYQAILCARNVSPGGGIFFTEKPEGGIILFNITAKHPSLNFKRPFTILWGVTLGIILAICDVGSPLSRMALIIVLFYTVFFIFLATKCQESTQILSERDHQEE